MAFMLTTIDNPFNPSTEYEEWLTFDESHGYNTNSYLARVVVMSNDISEGDQVQAIDDAIDEIVRLNVLGIYKKVEIPDSVEV